MWYILFITISMLLLSGCAPHPDYRDEGGSSEYGKSRLDQRYRLPGQIEKSDSPKTGKLIELGRIIQSYLGRPYRGKSRYDAGLDCSQFTREVFTKYNIESFPRTVRDQLKFGRDVANGNLQYGDLVFFNIKGNNISHVGIYIGHDEFIHSSTSSGVIISALKTKYWQRRFTGFRRVIP